jgi:probable rRNA maturation factor
MAPDGQRLEVIVGDARGRPVRLAGLSSWVRRVAPRRAAGRVSIALVGDARIRELNRTYRRKDYATDVLSFPHVFNSPPRKARRNGVSIITAADDFLGEIVIARGVARRQARAAGHSELTELRVLALHGLLHLLGYDHEADRGRMRRAEQRLRRAGGLREGLIERAASASPRPRGRSRPVAQ